jgi:hypothetical protein
MEENFGANEHIVEKTAGQNTEQENEQQGLIVKPDNHMLMAILTTACCCLPFGIVAIIKASQVNNLFIMEQYDAAQISAEEAKKWSYIGIGVGLVIDLIYFAATFLGMFMKN